MVKLQKAKLFMDTVIDIQVVTDDVHQEQALTHMEKAFELFRQVEAVCSRFNPDSELMYVCKRIQKPVKISPLLFEPIKIALEVAKLTNGVFDPTIGKLMEKNGFNRHYLTGDYVESQGDEGVTYKDIVLDDYQRTIYLKKPMVIDLGAVAKGFAIDLAKNTLREYNGFLINAGGDLFVYGMDENGHTWKVGIQHPTQKEQIIHTITISNAAICTSGGYERKNKKIQGMHHIMNPKTKQSPKKWLSCSIIAPFAMMADVFSTAVLLLDDDTGRKLIEEVGIKGLLISNDLQVIEVGGI